MLTNGKKIDDRYIIRKEIGSGGFGAVYLAEDLRFGGNNKVAVKRIVNTNAETAKYFKREADLLYNLSHPNLPKVTNCFQEDNANFIVMNYISGEDLSQKLKRGKKFSVEEVLEIADTVLDALEYLHSFLIFHRDIKPHNIKIDENGKIYLLDFGTAKGTIDETTLSRQTEMSVTGYTPFYAPLEQMLRVDANSYLLLQSTESPHLKQFLERKTDARSDIYSLGATLYHLLTNYSPENATATVRAHAIWTGKQEPLPDCQSLNPEIPDYLADVINRCLEILPKDRFQTATQTRQALKEPVISTTSEPVLDETLPITSDKVPIQKPDESVTPMPATVVAPAETEMSHPTRGIKGNTADESIAAGTVNDLFDKQTLDQKRNTSSKMPIMLAGIGAILLLAVAGIGGWFYFGSEKSEKSAKPPLATRTLDYSLLVQKMRDGKKYQDPFESSGQEIFETGYEFQMRFTPSEEGYLYVFNEGLDDEGEKVFNIIFPTPVRNDGKAKVKADEKYETGWNEFAGKPGTEDFWVIWSKEKNDMLEDSLDDAFESEIGELTDEDLKSDLRKFLDENYKKDREILKNFKKKSSEIKFVGDSAAHLIKLEHR